MWVWVDALLCWCGHVWLVPVGGLPVGGLPVPGGCVWLYRSAPAC